MRTLLGVHPTLVVKITSILEAMKMLGYPMVVTDGLRSDSEQKALYAKGRTVPGDIVTNADGVKVRSAHQVQPDGFGHAVDCAFLVQGKPSWDERLPWRLYGEMVLTLGLSWGGDFRTVRDRPHAELL